MFKKAVVIACAGLLAATATSVFARGGGGGGSPGGMAGPHISSQGLKNTNGPLSADRDKGLARAEDRRSVKGAAHEKAGTAHGKIKHHHRAHAPKGGEKVVTR